MKRLAGWSDTGAQSNQRDAKLARSLGLNPGYTVDLATASSTVRVPAGRLDLVQLGKAAATSQEFLFTNLQGVHHLSSEIQGVLGQEFLANFDYLFDFHGKQLVFGGMPELANRIPARILTGRIMAIPTSSGDLVFDSGTEALVLFHGAGFGARSTIRTASGLAEASTAAQFRLQIDGQEYRIPIAAFVAQTGRPESGLLPAGLFGSGYICNSGGYIVPGAGLR